MSPGLKMVRERYPGLYTRNFAFEIDDGWAGIIDALSETLVWRSGIEGRLPPQAKQVKEKFGTLRWYFGHTDADQGAIALAEGMSARVCELSGRPGRLGVRGGRWATRAPGMEPSFTTRDDDVPPLGLTPADVRQGRADVFEGELQVPRGWLDLVDGMLRQLADVPGPMRFEPAGTVTIVLGGPTPAPSVPVKVSRVWQGGGGNLRVDYLGGGAHAQGVVACATALAWRTDPETGMVS